MGGVISRGLLYVGEKVGVVADKREAARRDKLWRQNPQLRKLVPKARCPECKRRLEPKHWDSDSSSGDEMGPVVVAPPVTLPSATASYVNVGEEEEEVKKVVTFVEQFQPPKDNEMNFNEEEEVMMSPCGSKAAILDLATPTTVPI